MGREMIRPPGVFFRLSPVLRRLKSRDNRLMDSFFSELRRRNVLRLAATYALAAWILIEAGSVLLPTFGVPEWFFRVYVLVILAGFVVSLVLAWVFELTPDGVRLDSEVDRSKQASPKRGKSNAIIIALLVLALGVSITFNVTGLRNQGVSEESIALTEPSSIAVLPFSNRSPDPENQFFADGIHDDLLTRLAGIDSLRVISRTSVNEYRDTTKNLREIGTELDVTTIVEGAVQRSGNQVRITVQLIDAATDEHLWADSYDRELTTQNLFAIQSEISTQIANALRAALTPEEEVRLAVMPTKSIEALSYYTAGRNNLYLRRFDTLQEARRQFNQAIEIDPDYAQAYAGLAETILVTLTNHRSIEPSEAYELASRAIDKALQLDDQLAEAHAVDGLLKYSQWISTRIGDGNMEAAESFQRAIELNPNLSNSYVWFSTLRESEGDYETAAELLNKAMHVDPLGRIPYVNLPGFYDMQGKPEKALHLLLKAMEIFPDWATPYQYMANHLMSLGRLDEAVAWTYLGRTLTDDPMTKSTVMGAFIEFGDLDKITEFSEQFPADHPMYQMGEGFMRFTNSDYVGAIAALEYLQLNTEIETKYAYPLMSMSALMLRDFDKGKEFLLRANPLLTSDTTDNVDQQNYRSAILLAYAYQQTGDARRAERLLAEAERIVSRMHRIGIGGHGISDVHILALRGRNEAALAGLRDAIDEGFVSLMSYEMWTLDQDPMIDSLREDERFKAMKRELNRKIEAMRNNVERADESGDWSHLLNRVRGEDLVASLPVV
jgi:TolB-like protein/Flp pilus assembly protein TadD